MHIYETCCDKKKEKGRYASIILHILRKKAHGYLLRIYYFGVIFHSNGASDFTVSYAY